MVGITILNKSSINNYWPLDVSEMFGIGKTAPKLKNGYFNCGDVANYDNIINYVRLLGKMHFYYIEKQWNRYF